MINWLAEFSTRFALLSALLFAISACGGGGSDGGFIPDAPDNTTPLAITTTALPAVTEASYTAILEATGGTTPYTWVLEDDGGTGLTLSSEGILSGQAPSQSGTYAITISVTDSKNGSDRTSLTLEVDAQAAIQIITTALPQAINGLDYLTLIEASGGSQPYSWTVVSDGGTGFTIDDQGFLKGVAPTTGEYGLTIEVKDSAEGSDRVSLILTVTGDAQQPLEITTTDLSAEESKPFSAVLEAVGGQGTYLWTLLDDGNTGLQLRDDGILSGTAPAQGQYVVSVSVMDNTRTVSENLILTVAADGSPLTIITSSLPGGTVGERYAAVLEAVGGSGSYRWTLPSSGGSGLGISSDGVLSGVPTNAGTFGLVFDVSDSNSTASKAITVTISSGDDGSTEDVEITTTSLPDADRVIYAAAVDAKGGLPPYTWSGGDISNPGTGFVVDPSSGAITGNTNDLLPGQYGYRVSVSDTAGDSDTKSYVITVPGGDQPPVRIITNNPLPGATEKSTYAVVMRAVGGGADKTWKVLETLKSDGTVFLNGPTFDPPGSADSGVLYWGAVDIAAGDYLVTIQVVSDDSDSSTDVVTFNLKAVAAP